MDYKVFKHSNNYSIDTHYGVIDAVYTNSLTVMTQYELELLNISENEKVLFINNLYIQENYIGKGLGKKLLFEMIRYSKNKFKHILLCAEPVGHSTLDLKALIKFYSKYGFKPVKGNSKNCLMIYEKEQRKDSGTN